MPGSFVKPTDVVGKIAKALGLPDRPISELSLFVPPRGVVSFDVTYIVEVDQFDKLVTELRHYELVEKPDKEI